MSEKEKINEMDAAEMLEKHEAGPEEQRAVAEARAAEQASEQGETTGHWAADMIREFEADAKRWHHRQGWEAFGLCLVAGMTVLSCCAAILYGCWKPVVLGIAAANLMMTGAWWQKAKAGWQV